MALGPALFLALVLFGGSFLFLLSLHGLALLGLQGGVTDVPVQYELQDECDEDDKEDSEEDGLVVEDGDSLIGRADGREPVELTHWSGGLGASRSGTEQVEMIKESTLYRYRVCRTVEGRT